MKQDSGDRLDFLSFSAEAAGFPTDALLNTKQEMVYYDVARAAVGNQLLAEFLHSFRSLGVEETLASPKFGPIGRNVMKLWYTGGWERLPDAWLRQYGSGVNEGPFVAGADAYAEGLLWSAIGSHPPGAKVPGFGTWSSPPET
jgi:hypothetical protein